MKYKHNKEIVPLAKALRMNMTKEEKRLWYDYLREYPIRFIRQKVICWQLPLHKGAFFINIANSTKNIPQKIKL